MASGDPVFRLPDLAAFDGEGLASHGDYDAIGFAELDLSGQDAADARFTECHLEGCAVDGLSLRRARIIDSLLTEPHGASLDLADSTWRGSELRGGRLGAVSLMGAEWTNVRVRASKLGFLNLAASRLARVTFERCEIGTLDVSDAELTNVTLVDCSIEEFAVSGARLTDVDLSGARLSTIVGIESLRGATISSTQMLDLAPLLAAHLGLEVRR